MQVLLTSLRHLCKCFYGWSCYYLVDTLWSIKAETYYFLSWSFCILTNVYGQRCFLLKQTIQYDSTVYSTITMFTHNGNLCKKRSHLFFPFVLKKQKCQNLGKNLHAVIIVYHINYFYRHQHLVIQHTFLQDKAERKRKFVHHLQKETVKDYYYCFILS